MVTKDKHLLKSHGIDCIYEVGLPSEKLALEMLCLSAFRKKSPPEGFEKLAVEVAQLAGNLPLGLTVLGSSLRGMDKQEWINSLPRIHDSYGEIEGVLRYGYERLGDEDQALFRHIACLFNLEKVDDIKMLLADSGFKSFEIGLGNLVARSLVHVRLNIVEMHTLLQQLGKEIVRKQYHNPGKREFLVDSTDVCDVLSDEDTVVSFFQNLTC